MIQTAKGKVAAAAEVEALRGALCIGVGAVAVGRSAINMIGQLCNGSELQVADQADEVGLGGRH